MEARIKALFAEGKQKADVLDTLVKEFSDASVVEITDAIASAIKVMEAVKALDEKEMKEKEAEAAKAKAKLEADAKSTEIHDMVSKGVEDALEKIDIPSKLEAGNKTAPEFGSKFVKDLHAYKAADGWQANMCKMLRSRINGDIGTAAKISAEFVAQSKMHDDEMKAKVLRGDATTGSYAVPDEFSDMVITVAQRGSNIFENSTKITMGSDTMNLLGAGDVTFTDLTNQDTAATLSEPVLTQTTLNIYDTAAYSLLSDDLIMDSNVNMVSLLSDSYGRGLAKYLKQRTAIGSTVTGDKQNGVTFISGIGSVTAADEVNGTISWEDLMDTVAQIDESFLDGCVWEMNSNDWFQKLATLKDDDGRPLLVSPNGDWKQSSLGGYPIKWNNQMTRALDIDTSARTTGSDAVILFGNPKEVFMGLRGGFMFDSSKDFKFTTFQQTFRGKMRLDWDIVNKASYARLVVKTTA